MVESARPKNSAARSRMNRRNTCGPSRSAARRWPASPCAVTFRHSHISLEITSRMPRAPAARPRVAPAIALGFCGVVGQPEQRRPDVGPASGPGSMPRMPNSGPLSAPVPSLRRRVAEHPVHVDVDEPGGVVGPLDVAPGPEQGLGHPAEQLVVHWSGAALARSAAPRPGRAGGLRGCGLASSGRAAGVEARPRPTAGRPAPRCPWSRRPGWS